MRLRPGGMGHGRDARARVAWVNCPLFLLGDVRVEVCARIEDSRAAAGLERWCYRLRRWVRDPLDVVDAADEVDAVDGVDVVIPIGHT